MNARKFIISSLLAMTAVAATAENIHIHVTPAGITPHQALREGREMRRLRQVGATDTLFLDFADGIYRLDETLFIRPEDSGTPTSPTILRAIHSGKAILSGGREMTADRMGEGIATFQPTVNRRNITVRQLWSEDAKVPHASLVPLDSMLTMLDFDRENREICIPATDFTPFLSSSDGSKADPIDGLEMLVHQRWALAILRVKDYRVTGDTVRLSFFDPESRLEFEHPWPQPVIREDRGDGILVSSSYNLLGGAAVAKPGTWYQDLQTGTITYYLPAASRPSLSTAQYTHLTFPVLSQLVEVSGSLERPVHDVLFQGLSFQHAAWTRPSEKGHVTLQGGMYLLDAYKLQIPGLPEKEYLENQAWIERPEAAVTVRGGQRINFHLCEFLHLGATGLDFVWADSCCQVTRCHFEDIGGTALALGAFPDRGFETHVPFRPVNLHELCSDFNISYNNIINATNEDWGCVGIGAGYVADVTIDHNNLSDLNYSGICVGWGWTPLNSGMRNNHITNNKVSRFGKMLYDTGGIYTLSYQPGSSIENNYLFDLCPPRYATNLRGFYIYLDEATDGFIIRNNYCPQPLFGDNRPGPDVHWENNGPVSK